MANLKTYLQNLLDSFINNTEARQLMSAQSYPTASNAITVPVMGLLQSQERQSVNKMRQEYVISLFQI